MFGTQAVHVLCDESYGMFHFKVNMLRIIQNTVELSNDWFLNNLKYQEPVFYARSFDDYE